MYRFSVAGKLVDDIFVIGQKIPQSVVQLSEDDKQAIVSAYPNAKFDRLMMMHKRLLIHGVLFSSLEYQRQMTTCDYVMIFNDDHVGFITKYLSFCTVDCSSCSLPCQHVAVTKVFQSIQRKLIDDQLTGATATQFHCFNHIKSVYSSFTLYKSNCSLF